MRPSFGLLCASMAALGIVSASAAPITGGSTSVTLTSAPTLTAAGVSVAPFGTATLQTSGTFPVATFPITGGTASGSDLVIDHDGSGLDLSKGGSIASIQNFVIDTAAGTVSGDAYDNSAFVADIPLFTIGSGLTLSLTSQAAGALTTVLGLPNLTGLEIGTATTDPTIGAAVPEPATLPLLVLGAVAVVAANRFRRASAAA